MCHGVCVRHDVIRSFFDFVPLESKGLKDSVVTLQRFWWRRSEIRREKKKREKRNTRVLKVETVKADSKTLDDLLGFVDLFV